MLKYKTATNTDVDNIMEAYYNVGFLEHQYGPDGMSASGLWDAEARALVWAALNAPEGHFINFGAFQGASDVLLGLVQKHRREGFRVISVDIKHQPAWYRNVIGRARLSDYVENIDCSITKYIYPYENYGSIALSFSDSWHSYKAVLTEYDIANPNMIHAGAINLFHDVSPDLPNMEGSPSQEIIDLARKRHDELMQSVIPEIDPTNKSEYHASEAQQDFYIDLAIATICDQHNRKLIALPEFNHQPRFDMTNGDWERGKTSPYFSLRGII